MKIAYLQRKKNCTCLEILRICHSNTVVLGKGYDHVSGSIRPLYSHDDNEWQSEGAGNREDNSSPLIELLDMFDINIKDEGTLG